MVPYEKELICTATLPRQTIAVPFPGRCILDRFAVVRLGGGNINATLYNRAFVGPEANIKQTSNDGNGKLQIALWTRFACRVGDLLDVDYTSDTDAATSESLEHAQDVGAQRVTKIIDEYTVVTDAAFTTARTTGTVQIAIPESEQLLYQVYQLLGTNAEADDLENVYVNLDPVLNLNIGVNRMIYIQFADAGSYKVALRAREGVALGD